MRTQYGNNNAYSTNSDNEFNWFRWGEWRAQDERHRMKDFVAELAQLRKEGAAAFAPEDWGSAMPMAWKTAANQELNDWNTRQLMQHYYSPEGGEEWLILWNFEGYDVEFSLPTDRDWIRVVDTQAYFDEESYLDAAGRDYRQSANIMLDSDELMGQSYTAKAQTVVVMRSLP